MMMLKLAFLIPALLLGLVLSGLSLFMAFSFFPAWLVWTALAVLSVIVLWIGAGKKSGTLAAQNSEAVFLAQSSKEGLL